MGGRWKGLKKTRRASEGAGMASEGDERASVAAVEPQEELGGPQTKLKEPGSG